MTAQKAAPVERADAILDRSENLNKVRLVGRLAADPELREMPSGDTVWNLRLNIQRLPVRQRDRQRVDSLECAAWEGRIKTQVRTWSSGDLVEVEGALRRRFFKAGGATVSRVDVELTRGKVIRRAGSG